MTRVLNWVRRQGQLFRRAEESTSLAEYGLLLALIAVACITAIMLLGTRISALFDSLA